MQYTDSAASEIVIPGIKLGINTSGENFADNLKFQKQDKPKQIIDQYKAVHGKSASRSNKASESTYHFTNSNGRKLDVVVRAYDNGFAFKYILPDKSDKRITFIDELTTYEFSPKADRWLQRFLTSYEGFYPEQKNGVVQGQWGYPALFRADANKNSCWMLVTEAGLDSTYCATKMSNTANADQYKLVYPAQTDGNGAGKVQPSARLSWSSPWRVVIMGQLADVVESTLIEDISPASKIQNVSWIRSGTSSWVYWANNHGTKDYQKLVSYIDLAARMNWPYTLFDWEWDEMSNGGKLEDAVKYAASKGIKPMMWYNSGGPNGVSSTPKDRLLTHESRVKEFAWLKKIGVYGVKVDFFESDKQDMIKYYIDILKDAADAKLMVNFHGSTVPRGSSRTYPNLMSMEAVFGGEQYNNGAEMTTQGAWHNTTLPFTRNVIGPMDYTPVAFTNSQHPHTTSYAHELALSVVFESGIQHLADRPEGFDDLPDAPKAFLRDVPASWDATKFIDGYPGKRVIMARAKAGKWYLAGINGENNGGEVNVKLAFLPAGKKHKATIIGDGEYDTAFNTQYAVLNSNDVLNIKWLPRGGFTVLLEEE
ncbi:glycoside hydrolase family 97 catalytic domain-containing protein [Mucilaginibacter sp. JRF]|uniref:glycoside hydrolase family 97 protein n=1 Tax=Mucilaginibacter sp. JRF TaxID=2780088 RepID=UPI003221D246